MQLGSLWLQFSGAIRWQGWSRLAVPPGSRWRLAPAVPAQPLVRASIGQTGKRAQQGLAAGAPAKCGCLDPVFLFQLPASVASSLRSPSPFSQPFTAFRSQRRENHERHYQGLAFR